jgi:hypothetical protein
MASYKKNYEEVRDLLEKMVTYLEAYGQMPENKCQGCGEYMHPNYVCIWCGCDSSCEQSFFEWIEGELNDKTT